MECVILSSLPLSPFNFIALSNIIRKRVKSTSYIWFLCLSTSRKFFIKQWSGGSTDMFCRGCSSECNVKDVLMNQIWIDFGPKLLRNFSGIYFKFLRETVLVSRCSALNVDNLRATDRCQVTTNLYGTFHLHVGETYRIDLLWLDICLLLVGCPRSKLNISILEQFLAKI